MGILAPQRRDIHHIYQRNQLIAAADRLKNLQERIFLHEAHNTSLIRIEKTSDHNKKLPSHTDNITRHRSVKKYIQYKLIDLPTYTKKAELKQALSKFGTIKKLKISNTKIDLKHNNRESLTCIIDFFITDQEKEILDNTWSIQIYDQCIRLAPGGFSK